MENVRQVLEHVEILVHRACRDISQQDYARIRHALVAADGVLSVFHIALERAAHFVNIRKVYGLHLVQRNVIVTENQSLLPPGYIVEHSRAGHRPSR